MRLLSSPRSEVASEEQTTVFRNGFLIDSGWVPTHDRAGPKTRGVCGGEEAGEILITALAGVVGADMSTLWAKVGRLRLSRVGGAMVGSGWFFERMEVLLIDGWDSENFWTSLSAFMSSLLTHESCVGE